MTPEAQRIAIAEACPQSIRVYSGQWQYFATGHPEGEHWCRCVGNDPLSDLNAMHEAKMAVLFKDVDLYLNYPVELEMVVGGDIDAHYATAAQEAEAFLRTIGKWK